MRKTDSGLWVARGVSRRVDFKERRKTVRTVTLPTGERAKVTVDDSGTVMQIEQAEHLHAVVRPKPINVQLFVPQFGARRTA